MSAPPPTGNPTGILDTEGSFLCFSPDWVKDRFITIKASKFQI